MKRTFVIEVETIDPELDLDDSATDIATFRDAINDGSLLDAASRNLPDGKGYPELKNLKARIKHEIPGDKEEKDEEEEAGVAQGDDNG